MGSTGRSPQHSPAKPHPTKSAEARLPPASPALPVNRTPIVPFSWLRYMHGGSPSAQRAPPPANLATLPTCFLNSFPTSQPPVSCHHHLRLLLRTLCPTFVGCPQHPDLHWRVHLPAQRCTAAAFHPSIHPILPNALLSAKQSSRCEEMPYCPVLPPPVAAKNAPSFCCASLCAWSGLL